MRPRLVYLCCWSAGCVLLFFCLFARVDPDGTIVGWLAATRPGWFWVTMKAYWAVVVGTLIPWLFIKDPDDRRGD